MRLAVSLTLFSILCITGCSQMPGKPMANPNAVIKNYKAFAYYQQQHLRLSENFAAYDSSLHQISKKMFLQALTSGKYLPLRFSSKTGRWTYTLYPLGDNADEDVSRTISQIGENYLQHYNEEGRKFPPFHFVDLNGKIYTNKNTQGKIIVLKSWFIHCLVCNQEMPELNKVVDEYKNRNDIIFISVAFDSREALTEFNKTARFKYAIVPVAEQYINNVLNAHEYPTHWIINKEGIIVKRTNESAEIITALRIESKKN